MSLEKFELADSTTPKILVEKLADKLSLTNDEKDLILATIDFCLSIDETEEPFEIEALREKVGRKTAKELDTIFANKLRAPLIVWQAFKTGVVKIGRRPGDESPGFYETDVVEAKEELENVFNEKVLSDLRKKLDGTRKEDGRP